MRKSPRQARSRATVAAIVEAGARVLGDLGWTDFTTNKVADAAGVSIGSLYQYFPDKRSLVEAIRVHHFDDVLAVLDRCAIGPASPMRFAETLVRGMISVHSRHPALHRELLDAAPGLDGSRAPHAAFEQDYLDRYAAAIAAHRTHATPTDDAVVARVLSSVVEGAIHNAARAGTLASVELERELVVLVCAYLSAGADPPAHARNQKSASQSTVTTPASKSTDVT